MPALLISHMYKCTKTNTPYAAYHHCRQNTVPACPSASQTSGTSVTAESATAFKFFARGQDSPALLIISVSDSFSSSA